MLACEIVPSLGRARQARLEAWKAAQPRAYHDAYMGLSAPAVFAPFVRLELLAWDPLYGQRAGAAQPACWCTPRRSTIVLLHNCPELLA